MKALGSTKEVQRKLPSSSSEEGRGMASVEVKFVDIERNIGGEGGLLDDD